MTVESAIAFSIVLIVWVLIPGPAVLAVVARSLTTGLKPALMLIAGILLGDTFYIAIVLFGMAAVGTALGDLFYIVKLVGASYLIFLGIKMWLADPDFTSRARDIGASAGFKNYLVGFSITLGNPKAILFHIGFLPTFFDLATINLIDSLIILSIFMLVVGTSFVFYAFAATKARLFFKDPRRIRFLNRGAGTMLIGAGVVVATRD